MISFPAGGLVVVSWIAYSLCQITFFLVGTFLDLDLWVYYILYPKVSAFYWRSDYDNQLTQLIMMVVGGGPWF
jgi:hypothetical protein